MSAKRAISIGLTATSLTLFVPSAEGSRGDGEEPVVDAVRGATARFRNVDEAIAEGYVLFQGCVSGAEEGAMGVHYVKFSLFDGVIDMATPASVPLRPRSESLRAGRLLRAARLGVEAQSQGTFADWNPGLVCGVCGRGHDAFIHRACALRRHLQRPEAANGVATPPPVAVPVRHWR